MAQYSNCPEPTATAALFNREAVLRTFLEIGRSSVLNSPTSHTLWTPLMFAASIGSKPSCQLLIDKGADPDRTNCLETTALEIAMACGSSEVRAYLQGKTSVSLSKQFANQGADFFEAVREGDMETVQEFLSNDAVDVNALDGMGASALMMAAICGHGDIVDLLVQLEADVNLQDFVNGWTALMQATFYGQKHIAKSLMKSGADPTLCANNGCTALDLATLVEETDTELLRLLAGQTIEACPPSLSFRPAKSMSMSDLNQPKPPGDSKGFKAWLSKLSGRFKNVKPEQRPVKSGIRHKKRDHLVVDNIETHIDGSMNLDQSVFTLGFAAATTDLSSYLVSPMNPPSFETEQLELQLRQLNGPRNQTRRFIPDGFSKDAGKSNYGQSKNRRTKSAATRHSKAHGAVGFHSSVDEVELRRQQKSAGKTKKGHSRTQSNQSDPGPRKLKDKDYKPKDVKTVLKKLYLTKYLELFDRQEIDLKAFKELSEDDLKDIGITSRESRAAILSEIKKLSSIP